MCWQPWTLSNPVIEGKWIFSSNPPPNWIYNGMVTIYTENGDSIDIILCGECGAGGGGSHSIVKHFCQGKFNSIPFINIKTSPFLLNSRLSCLMLSWHHHGHTDISMTRHVSPADAPCQAGYSPRVWGPTKSIILPPFCATSVLGME